jgi:hypothetical protein
MTKVEKSCILMIVREIRGRFREKMNRSIKKSFIPIKFIACRSKGG